MNKFNNRAKILFSMIFIFAALFFSNCDKDDSVSPVPNKYINIYINPNSTQYINLNTVGGWVYLTDGVGGKGLIVYRIGIDEFKAFDRTCTYDADLTDAIVEVEPSGITVIDSLCGSRYILLDGSVATGPATIPLKEYRTTYDGNLLHIYN